MTTTEDVKTEEVVTYELHVQLQVDVPTAALKQYDKPIEELRDDEILDIIAEDTDRIPDALAQMFERQDFTTSYVEVGTWEEEHEAPVLEAVPFAKPEDGKPYTLPIPNFISGNMRLTEEGMEFIEESPVNVLSDEQLRGAYFAAKRIWGLRGMHRYQQEQMAEFLSELQWGMLARPTLHSFKAGEETTGDLFDAALCVYCGHIQAVHSDENGGE